VFSLVALVYHRAIKNMHKVSSREKKIIKYLFKRIPAFPVVKKLVKANDVIAEENSQMIFDVL